MGLFFFLGEGDEYSTCVILGYLRKVFAEKIAKFVYFVLHF